MKPKALSKRFKKNMALANQGALIGFGLTLAWHYFLSVWMDWGDMAPDWYFEHQELIVLLIFLLGTIGWILVIPRLEGFLNSNKSE